jgi:predicted phosphodiesterase
MRDFRPRLSETQNNYWQLKKLYDKKLYKVLLFSDPHGWLADLSALRCINQILQHNQFDEVCINGDVIDAPYISRHSSKLYEDGILAGYSEVKEIEYTKEQILAPLRASTDANIRVRTGNHDDRIIKPVNIQQSQLARLAVLYKNYETTEFNKMLALDKNNGYTYDPSDIYTYFDKFDVTHGLSLAKNAPEKNIQEYMSSGATGHTHRLNSKYLTNRKAPYVWLELGCTRLIQQVEYLPTGKIADWQNGFATVYFSTEGDKVRFYAQTHIIIDGKCFFNGVVYDGSAENIQKKVA